MVVVLTSIQTFAVVFVSICIDIKHEKTWNQSEQIGSKVSMFQTYCPRSKQSTS